MKRRPREFEAMLVQLKRRGLIDDREKLTEAGNAEALRLVEELR